MDRIFGRSGTFEINGEWDTEETAQREMDEYNRQVSRTFGACPYCDAALADIAITAHGAWTAVCRVGHDFMVPGRDVSIEVGNTRYIFEARGSIRREDA